MKLADKIVFHDIMFVNPNDIEHNNDVIAEAVAHGKKLAEISGQPHQNIDVAIPVKNH